MDPHFKAIYEISFLSIYSKNKDFFFQREYKCGRSSIGKNDKIRLNNNETEDRQTIANDWKLWE